MSQVKTESDQYQHLYSVFKHRKVEWRWSPCGDFDSISIYVYTAPNAFHRLMQRLFLGIKWEKI